MLQLTNLHGDIIATAYLSETATGLASKADTTEFGVPTTSLPPKYSWLGSLELPTELPSGVMTMGVRSYVPELGRFLQPDPIPGGSANAYAYTFQDPINTNDPTGQSTIAELVAGFAHQVGQEGKAAEEAAARAAAEQAAREAALWAELDAGPNYTANNTGGEEELGEEEWGEEEGGYEYASYHHGGEDGEEEDQVEEGLLYQPLEAPSGEKETKARGTVSLCADAAGKAPEPCARFTSAWGFIESFGHEAEDLYHKGKRFVHKLLSGLKVHAPSGGDYACAAFGVGVSYALTDSPFLEQATIGALSGLGCASVTH